MCDNSQFMLNSHISTQQLGIQCNNHRSDPHNNKHLCELRPSVIQVIRCVSGTL